MATIFVVDDDDDIRELLKYNLEKSGHYVITCENGIECLEKLQ
jgi:two-component system alkaline phosphatase synthesis response regulator PhoP